MIVYAADKISNFFSFAVKQRILIVMSVVTSLY